MDNMRDMSRKGRWNNPQVHQTHCNKGHEFTPANTRLQDGKRICRMCKRLWARHKRENLTPEQREAYLAKRRAQRRGLAP